MEWSKKKRWRRRKSPNFNKWSVETGCSVPCWPASNFLSTAQGNEMNVLALPPCEFFAPVYGPCRFWRALTSPSRLQAAACIFGHGRFGDQNFGRKIVGANGKHQRVLVTLVVALSCLFVVAIKCARICTKRKKYATRTRLDTTHRT